MSMLTVIQKFCRRTGLTVPAAVMASTDPQVLQILAILEEEGEELRARGDWQGITFEATHTSLATESQGDIDTIATNAFRHIKNDTFWDRTDQFPIMGPLSDTEWQARKALVSTGPRYHFRFRGNLLLVTPTMTAGHALAFEYVSNNWIVDTGGTVYSSSFNADTDEVLLPETLFLLGLRWRWNAQKGFDYAELFRQYEAQVSKALGNDGGKKVLSMDNCGEREPRPGVFVPSYNWNLP